MTEIELLEHVLENRKAGRAAGDGLLYMDAEMDDSIKTRHISFGNPSAYSLAPKTRNINGFEVPEPITDRNRMITGWLWCLNDSFDIGVSCLFPTDADLFDTLFNAGVIFETKEDAIANAKALKGIDPKK